VRDSHIWHEILKMALSVLQKLQDGGTVPHQDDGLVPQKLQNDS
jgi:hypothetical protein